MAGHVARMDKQEMTTKYLLESLKETIVWPCQKWLNRVLEKLDVKTERTSDMLNNEPSWRGA
jgi:hypothetical protein